jgi:hypothetical protein
MYAAWKPEKLVQASSPEGKNLYLLKDQKYLDLKQQVLNYLENSWCSKEKATMIMDFLVLEQPQTCVEIGVFSGSSLLPIASALKYLNRGVVYAIDPWSNSEATKNMTDQDPNKQWWSTVDMSAVSLSFQQMLKEWGLESYCITIPMPSANAINDIKTIDFLHLDGNYTEEGSCNDVKLYLPKVKKGGYILFSNLYLTIHNIQPKMPSFSMLLDSCEIICEIEHNNCILLRKISD